jgi:hypothetical protein
MSKPRVVACPRCAATIDGDTLACPKCGQSMTLTPTMRRLETIVDRFLDGSWEILGALLVEVILYVLVIAVVVSCVLFRFL